MALDRAESGCARQARPNTYGRFDSHLQTGQTLAPLSQLQPTCIDSHAIAAVTFHHSALLAPTTPHTYSRIGSLRSRLLLLARQNEYRAAAPRPDTNIKTPGPHHPSVLSRISSSSSSFLSPPSPRPSPHSIPLTAMATPRTFARALTRLRPSSSQIPSAPCLRRFGSTSTTPVTIPKAVATPSNYRAFPRLIRPAPSKSVRSFSSTPSTRHGHVEPPKPGEELWVTFIDKDGQEHKLAVSKGDNLLDIAQAHDLEMEGMRSQEPSRPPGPPFSHLC